MVGFQKSQLTRLQEFYNLLPTCRRKRPNLLLISKNKEKQHAILHTALVVYRQLFMCDVVEYNLRLSVV